MSASQRLLCNLTHTLPCLPSSFTFSYSGNFHFLRLRRPYTVTATRSIGLTTTSISVSNSIMPRENQQRGGHIERTWKYKSKKNGSPSATGTSVTNEAEAVTNTLDGLTICKAYGTVSGGQTLGAENASIGKMRIQSQGIATDTATAQSGTVGLSKLFRGDFENFKVDNFTYSSAQIRATFYPKFENEKTDQEIRIRMIEMVSRGQANLEVSLKHSGSLFMYAGHEGGAYAKNSFGNIYTAVGVFVLGRTFREAWGAEASKKQAEFNEFLERNRMCISMELVTAVLGDHGQRPREDYVVVTAVTELGNGKPKFYSTPDIITFCRKWRLPTNHVWLFANRKSATSFFAAYDALCEEGTATTVCQTLDEIADISVPGSKDHIKYQGEILEGLVARIVSQESTSYMEKVLTDYPPPPAASEGIDLGPSLREICAANRSDESQQIRALLQNVGNAFCPDYSDWFGVDNADIQSRNVDKSVVVKFLQAHPADYSTKKLQEMVRLIREKRYPAAFKFYHNFHKIDSLASDNIFYKMVIHVHSDSAFRRYQSDMRQKPGLWPLYRGFFVDINLFKGKKESATEMSSNDNDICDDGSNIYGKDGLADEDANLMIKLKFLTYKLRTFLIRNGLSILFKEGPAAYKSYYLKQMKRWGTSAGKQRELSKMLDEWAIHIRRKCGNKQLSSATYLSEVEPFLEQYAKRCPQNQILIGSAGSFVKADDFLAIIEGYKDVEGDLETERQSAPSSPSHVKDIIPKDEGLIVFFPGIPGCAKSALCRELLNCPEVLGDDRPIHSLMGDLVKGKYWQKVADERKKRPNSILLADKNAPNEEVWRLIEDMCRRTRASAVPVVTESEGTDSNPFSLDALAVFMFRVLQRVNHPGNLDKESQNAGYVLLMFYHLYEGKSRKEFESELMERFGSLVKMPLLKSDRNPLPYPVQSTLEEGIDLYKLHTSRHGRADSTKGFYAKEWSKWEKQLREVLFSNAEYFNSVQVPFEFAVKQVQEQIRIVAKGDFTTPETEKRKFGAIVFAAVSLPVAEIQVVLRHWAEKNDKVKALLENMHIDNLRRAHLTLAHKRSHGIKAVADYSIFLNKKVPVDFTALLFSDKMAAFEARPGSVEGEAVVSKNAWPHVTLWTAEGIAAKEANLLPQLLAEGKATRVDFTPPLTMCGTLEFF